MGIEWGSLLIVFVVSFGSAVLVVALVSVALVALSGRTAAVGKSGTRPAVASSGSGTVVGGLCLVAATAIVLYGLYVIVAA
jgi:hypothetical protein